MGELLPCPFCNCEAEEFAEVDDEIVPLVAGHNVPVSRRSEFFGVRCSTCDVSQTNYYVERDDAITAWNTRPRTEGRGEGEKLFPLLASAWFYGDWKAETHNERQMQVVMERAGWWPITSEAELLGKLDASPIREPEISRTSLIAALDVKLAEVGGAFLSNDQAADAILNLAPVGGRGEGSKALADVAAERQRQMEVEGWTPEHDDGHGGDLLTAAVCYAQRRMDEDRFGVFANYAPAAWPWDASWWKPNDRRRDLIRAAALLVAEIERLDRLPLPPQDQGGMK